MNPTKSKILKIGTVSNGRPFGWIFDALPPGPRIEGPGYHGWTGWTYDELKAIAESGVIPGQSMKCPECGYVSGERGGFDHSSKCSLMDLNTAIRRIEALKSQNEHLARDRRRAIEAAQRWEGKFRVVKHENNQLRRALEKAKAGPAEDPVDEITKGSLVTHKSGGFPGLGVVTEVRNNSINVRNSEGDIFCRRKNLILFKP